MPIRALLLCLAGISALASFAQPCDVSVTTVAITCGGATDGSITIVTNSGGPYVYVWDVDPTQNVPTFNNLGAGLYTINVSDGPNCDTLIFVLLEDPGVAIEGITDYCPSDPPVLTATPVGGLYPVTWLWSTGDTVPTINIPAGTTGPIDVTVTDSLGCQGQAQVTLVELPSPVVAMAAPDTACMNVPILVETIVTTADSVVWTWGGFGFSNQLDPIIAFPAAGIQPVTLQGFDSLGCGGLAVLDSIYILAQVPAIFTAEQVPCTPMVDIVLGSTADSCAFFIGDSLFTNDCAAYFRQDMVRYDVYTYTLYATQANGCNDTLEIVVDVRTEPTLFIANAFSPNGDGINDRWPDRVDFPDTGFELRLYDRWGVDIWGTEDPNEQWDGSIGSATAPVGVYAYTVRRRDPCEPTREIAGTGHLVLVR
ncbi:MAG: gliding motility-associated C-terminal domain-containing protein [Flavobacteriales bacterium]